MADADITNRNYPDLIAAGGLSSALQAALDSIGSGLKIRQLDNSIRFVAYARVEFRRRFSQVYIAAEERLFLFDFWSNGVMMAKGWTPDLADMVGAINWWVSSDCTTAELASEFSFVAVSSSATVYEAGEEVEHRWQAYLSTIGDRFPELKSFVIAAAARQELRNLFPYTSLNLLCFSRCTGYPFTRDTPYVRPLNDNEYQVVGPTGHVLGKGNGEIAADLVVRNLPHGCGPAVPGTAEDIAEV